MSKNAEIAIGTRQNQRRDGAGVEGAFGRDDFKLEIAHGYFSTAAFSARSNTSSMEPAM